MQPPPPSQPQGRLGGFQVRAFNCRSGFGALTFACQHGCWPLLLSGLCLLHLHSVHMPQLAG